MALTSFSSIAKAPLLGMWSVQGSEAKHLGALYAEEGQLRLRLFIDEARHDQSGVHHPTMEAIATARQPTALTLRAARSLLFFDVYVSARREALNLRRLHLESSSF
jgi:hypothetical protein